MEKPIGHREKSPVSNGLIILSFLIAALSIMFIALTIAYLFSRDQWTWQQYRFPKMFLLSTIVMVASSLTLIKSKKHLANSQIGQHKKWMNVTLVLGITFLVFQVIGWQNLVAAGIYMNGSPDGSYLYLISGLHALHLIVGILLLYWMFRNTRGKLGAPVDELLRLAIPEYAQKFRLLEIYWHFVGVLWVYLLFFFLFNHL